MPILALLLLALLGAAGCSGSPVRDHRGDRPAGRDAELAQFYGRPAADLVKAWGPPKSIRQLEERMLEYRYPRPDIDPSCIHFWVMNRYNFVSAHRHEGDCA